MFPNLLKSTVRRIGRCPTTLANNVFVRPSKMMPDYNKSIFKLENARRNLTYLVTPLVTNGTRQSLSVVNNNTSAMVARNSTYSRTEDKLSETAGRFIPQRVKFRQPGDTLIKKYEGVGYLQKIDPTFNETKFLAQAEEAILLISDKLSKGQFEDIADIIEPREFQRLKAAYDELDETMRDCLKLNGEDINSSKLLPDCIFNKKQDFIEFRSTIGIAMMNAGGKVRHLCVQIHPAVVCGQCLVNHGKRYRTTAKYNEPSSEMFVKHTVRSATRQLRSRGMTTNPTMPYFRMTSRHILLSNKPTEFVQSRLRFSTKYSEKSMEVHVKNIDNNVHSQTAGQSDTVTDGSNNNETVLKSSDGEPTANSFETMGNIDAMPEVSSNNETVLKSNYSSSKEIISESNKETQREKETISNSIEAKIKRDSCSESTNSDDKIEEHKMKDIGTANAFSLINLYDPEFTEKKLLEDSKQTIATVSELIANGQFSVLQDYIEMDEWKRIKHLYESTLVPVTRSFLRVYEQDIAKCGLHRQAFHSKDENCVYVSVVVRGNNTRYPVYIFWRRKFGCVYMYKKYLDSTKDLKICQIQHVNFLYQRLL